MHHVYFMKKNTLDRSVEGQLVIVELGGEVLVVAVKEELGGVVVVVVLLVVDEVVASLVR